MLEEMQREQLAAWRKYLQERPGKVGDFIAQIHHMESDQFSNYMVDEFQKLTEGKIFVTAYDLRVVLGEVKAEIDGWKQQN